MKKILIILIWLFSLFSLTNIVDASIFQNWSTEIQYCSWDSCWLDKWINEVAKSDIDWMVKNTTMSSYIQRILVYLLWFLKLVSVILVIYAWFNMLTSAWNDEKFKKSKTMIIYAIIWLAVIWLAWPITNFIINLFVNNAK